MRKYLLVFIAFIMAASPLCLADSSGHPDTSGEEWIDLFNGTDLTGWMSPEGKKYTGKTASKKGSGWAAENNILTRKGKDGNIWTTKRFGDFILDLEFDATGNSGILLRCDKPIDFVQTCIEMQIEKTGGPENKKGLGAIYDCLAPAVQVGGKGWHHVTVTCNDNKITAVIDGKQTIDMDLDKWDTPGKNPDGSKHKFKKALKDYKREGHIGLQDHSKRVMYRNVKIKILK